MAQIASTVETVLSRTVDMGYLLVIHPKRDTDSV
jgi:hypothetical protein